MSEKLTGFILLGVGILIMTIAVIQILSIMSGNTVPVHIFSHGDSSPVDSANPVFNPLDPSSILKNINSGDFSSLNLIDPTVIANLLNIIVYYLIMQFLLGFGFKISSLGIQLLRPIQVNMRHRELKSGDDKNAPPFNPPETGA